MNKKVALFALASSLTSCGHPPTIYHWGSYEDLIYASYAKPGSVPPEKQIEKLEADLEKARASNKPMPPGFYAHLGYLYFQTGKFAEAQQQFKNETKVFPESSTLMNRFLSRMGKQ